MADVKSELLEFNRKNLWKSQKLFAQISDNFPRSINIFAFNYLKAILGTLLFVLFSMK